VCKLIGPDLVNAVLPTVQGLTSHPRDLVRKKAIMALHRFQQLDPDHEGHLAGVELDKFYRQALCDKVRLFWRGASLRCPLVWSAKPRPCATRRAFFQGQLCCRLLLHCCGEAMHDWAVHARLSAIVKQGSM
jgi:hypothetical protein